MKSNTIVLKWHVNVFEKMIAVYAVWLKRVLNHQWITLGVALSTLVLTILLYLFIPKGFFPLQDNGLLQGTIESSQSISYQAMVEKQQHVVDKLIEDPAIDNIASFVGIDVSNATLNTGRLQITLKPLDQRDSRVDTIIPRLQARIASISGVTLYLQPTQDLTIDTQVSRTQYQFTLQATSLDELAYWVPKLSQALKDSPELTDISSDWQDNGMMAYIKVDRDSASRLGISMSEIDNALYNAFGQRLISTIYTQANQYRVVLEQDIRSGNGLQALSAVHLTGKDGAMVPLLSIASVEQRLAPLSINHQEQFPSATFSFNVAEQSSLEEAVKAVKLAEEQISMPKDITTQFQGATLAFESALSSTLWLIIAAIVAMYIVLGVLYESFIHPITILSTLPTAGVGALLALMAAGNELDIIAIIGIILLIGIVEKCDHDDRFCSCC